MSTLTEDSSTVDADTKRLLTPASPCIQSEPIERNINKDCLKAEILKELTSIFNKRVEDFFNADVQTSLEALVDAKFADFTNQSTQNASVLEQSFTTRGNIEERVSLLEQISDTKINKINANMDELKKVIEKKNIQISDLIEENKKLRGDNICLTQENLNLHESVLNKGTPVEITQRLNLLENKVDNCSVGLDNVQQYTRQGTLEFKHIPKQGNANNPEDCYDVISQFCDQYLDITVRRYDISIAHRQYNPAEKRKYGKEYIPSMGHLQQTYTVHFHDFWPTCPFHDLSETIFGNISLKKLVTSIIYLSNFFVPPKLASYHHSELKSAKMEYFELFFQKLRKT